jgi:hypothetical protein
MESPLRIWPLAIKFDDGYTNRRSMARFSVI